MVSPSVLLSQFAACRFMSGSICSRLLSLQPRFFKSINRFSRWRQLSRYLEFLSLCLVISMWPKPSHTGVPGPSQTMRSTAGHDSLRPRVRLSGFGRLDKSDCFVQTQRHLQQEVCTVLGDWWIVSFRMSYARGQNFVK